MAEESFSEDREKKYQERQKLLAELNKLREKNEELEYYVKNISSIDFPKINLSEASDWLVENERKAGVDIKGYKHQVAKNFVYHTLNKHGDAEAEKLRGNVAVTNDDITNLKEVFENPDLVAFGLKRNGEDLIAYTKKLPNGTSVYLEEILSGKKNKALRSKTLYKKAGEISKEKFRRIISSNPHNDCSKMNIALGEEAKSSVLRSHENGIGSQIRSPIGYKSNISQNQNLSTNQQSQEKIMPGQKEIQSAKKTLLAWATQDTYDEADGLTGKEIFEKYDNTPVPIAILPKRAEIIFDGNDRNIYCGKAYFIDHMVNHHSELDVSEYESLQDDLDNFDKVYLDPKNESVSFERSKNNKKYLIIVKQDLQGHLLFYKSYHYGDKTKKRFIEIDLEKLREKLSVEAGNPSINHLEDSRFGRLLSALTDNKTISQNNNLSNQEKLQEEKTMPEQNTIHAFTDDEKKMSDFNELTKREFLDSHSDVNEADYDATVAELKEKGEYTAPWNTIKEILGKDKSGELDYERNLHFDEAYEPEEKNFLSKFDAAYFTIEKYISHRGLDMDTYKDLFGEISEEKATEIEDEKRNILGPEVVEKLIKGPADMNGPSNFEDFTDIQQAYDRALAKSKTYQKIVAEELQQSIGKRDNLFVTSIADYLNSAMRHYYENREPETAKKCEIILSEALFTAETEINTEAFKTLLENGADITYRKTEAINGKEHKANILHYIAADDNIEALSLLMDDTPYGKPFNRLSAGEKLYLLREQNFEGRTPLEVSENYYREEPSRYEPDMIMPDVMRELAYQEEDLMSHVPPLVLTDKLTGNILMVEQSYGDGCEINLFDKNKKLVDHDISSSYTNNLGKSADYESSLEAARVSMAEYEKQNLWGNFYKYEKVPATVSQIQALRNSRDEFFKTMDTLDEKLNPKLSEIIRNNPFISGIAKFTTFIPKEVFDKLGIDIGENEDFYRLVISLTKNRRVYEWYLDAGSAMAGVGENLDIYFSPEENNRFHFLFEKVNDVIREKYPSIENLIDSEKKGSRTVTQSVTFPAHFIMAEKQSLSLLEKLQEKYGFGENDFEKFVNDGDVDIHFAAPVPKEYQFPKSKTDEWIKSVCEDLEENFGASDVAGGMDGSERVEKVFGTVEEAEKFVAENIVVGVGVAPTISALRFPEEQPATRLRPSPTTITENITPQSQKSSEAQFKDFVKEVEAEYKDLRLFRKATVNVLKRLPPEQKAAIKSELLKRGANNPESLALVMKNEVQKQHSQKKNQEKYRNRNDYEPER